MCCLSRRASLLSRRLAQKTTSLGRLWTYRPT
ncbi:hypothetical protein PPTG_21112 [Phytophthora nicotianae INRA-310]|uniref:Uncharacterized protein n=1 Tax=Phytophthora nicotianae (strain INRA-310) TaxID=761204 RepID=W2RAD3_PHYN3|nr:hypothetical protein PPTG_21112 [Phytophthora nicotianae INRA-310]ETN21669.1 hypothetical protein PPTG_21112 [Phytophthora nicotianae INRA-310]